MSLETVFLLLGWGALGTILVTALCSSNPPEADRAHNWSKIGISALPLIVLGLLGWLVAMRGGIATTVANMDASAWAAWVQAESVPNRSQDRASRSQEGSGLHRDHLGARLRLARANQASDRKLTPRGQS
jgi:hypothetical protein